MEIDQKNPFPSAPFVLKMPNADIPGAPSGVKIFIDLYRCIGCGMCAEVCPFGLPQPGEFGKYDIPRADLCTECSACKRNCPTEAIVMQEREGCGCLWDVASRKKNAKNNKKNGKNGCDTSSNSCCG